MGLFLFEVRPMPEDERLYDDIVDWLREFYPDDTGDETQQYAERIYQAWLDGVV